MTETPPTTRDGSAPTTRDGASPSTTRDAGSAATTRDGAAGSYVRTNLPQALAQRFEVVDDVKAAGGEADLLVVRDRETNAILVAKLYRPGIRLDGSLYERLGRISRDHVPQIVEHGEADGVWYELLEHIQGGSLQKLFTESGGRVDASVARTVLLEVSTALEAFHAERLVHRDLKPENVMVRTHDPLDLVLVDFGLATVMAQSSRMTSAHRTRAYAAPEAASGHVSPARDWWSLGMMLLLGLTGRHPFDKLSDPVIDKALATRSIDVSGVADAAWRTLCQGLLVRDPDKRWGADEVRRWLDGEVVPVDPDANPVATESVGYTFLETPHSGPRALAATMLQRWSDSARALARKPVLDSLRNWVVQQTSNADLALAFAEAEEADNPDLRVARLVWAFDPTLPPVLRSGRGSAGDDVLISVDHDGLLALARAGLAQPTSDDGKDILALRRDGFLNAYPTLRPVATAWAEQYDEVRLLIEAAQAAGAPKDLPEGQWTQVSCLTLMRAVDESTGDDVITRGLTTQPLDEARSRSWFTKIPDSPAGRIASVVLATVAAGQQRDEEQQRKEQAEAAVRAARAAQEQREATERREQAQREAQEAARLNSSIDRRRKSAGLLLPFVVLLTAGLVLVRQYAETGHTGISGIDSWIDEGGVSPGVAHQIGLHRTAITGWLVLETLALAALIGTLVLTRRARTPSGARLLTAANIAGSVLTPVVLPLAGRRAYDDAAREGNRYSSGRLRAWLGFGTLMYGATALAIPLLHERAQRFPYALEYKVINELPSGAQSWYVNSWPSCLTLTEQSARHQGVAWLYALGAAVCAWATLRTFRSRRPWQQRGLLLIAATAALPTLALAPYLGVVVFWILMIAVGLAVVALIFAMLAAG